MTQERYAIEREGVANALDNGSGVKGAEMGGKANGRPEKSGGNPPGAPFPLRVTKAQTASMKTQNTK